MSPLILAPFPPRGTAGSLRVYVGLTDPNGFSQTTDRIVQFRCYVTDVRAEFESTRVMVAPVLSKCLITHTFQYRKKTVVTKLHEMNAELVSWIDLNGRDAI